MSSATHSSTIAVTPAQPEVANDSESASELDVCLREVIRYVQVSKFASLGICINPKLQTQSIFSAVPVELKERCLQLIRDSICEAGGDQRLSRCVGSMQAMAIADGIGHNFEFLAVQDEVTAGSPHFEYPCSSEPGGKVHNSPFVSGIHGRNNKLGSIGTFQLKPGQWTDDTSMGLCLADSLIIKGGFDGVFTRVLFWHWNENGLNNGFRFDEDRIQYYQQAGLQDCSISVGLGANIAKSLSEMTSFLSRGQTSTKELPTPVFQSDSEDAGNGSLMRLAPVALFFHSDATRAREVAFQSSLTTHPGQAAAAACAVWAHLIAAAVSRPGAEDETIADLIDREVAHLLANVVPQDQEQLKGSSMNGWRDVIRVLQSKERPDGREGCWNWRSPRLEVTRALAARGKLYNDRPVNPGYFGAYSLDGMALALHCAYHTRSLSEAIVKVINYCGDSDSTGSICAQLVGAYYGATRIDQVWVRQLRHWDHGEIELRAALLCRYMALNPLDRRHNKSSSEGAREGEASDAGKPECLLS